MNSPHRCSVCADAADHAIVRALNGNDADLELVCSQERITAAVDLIPGIAVGDAVLIHQGVAIARVPSSESVSTPDERPDPAAEEASR